ncbi:uncharacterized protein DNG_07021 [Cephalotrichum gorgonifer]|uniref:Uncharacterized protein n=1 Tax=Cephalotrichum gorgonifer TaxID=2041049 RepID=A0AAE8SXV0_9PEZI|nr:uncharacterized protein DNG_07021 [Cephalotrichum gorgonifer]
MKPISALLSLLPFLANATPLLPRQGPQAQITSITASGPGCAPGTFSTSIDPTSAIATFGFDAYQSAIGAGVPGSDREKHCELFLTVRFPLGCTTASVTTTSHGFAVLGAGTSGVVATGYNISPGNLSNGNPPSKTLSGAQWADGDVYQKEDQNVARVQINGEGQRDVQFVVRSRVFVTGSGSNPEGLVTTDDIVVAITGLQTC